MAVAKLDKVEIYNNIINDMCKTYKAKNADYGDSVGDTYNKFGDVSFLTRITDKYNRILSLSDKGECGEVKDERLDDTILDLANYCVLWLVERKYKAEQSYDKVANLALKEIDCTTFEELTELSKKYPNLIPKQFIETEENEHNCNECGECKSTPKSETLADTLAGMTKTFLKSSYK